MINEHGDDKFPAKDKSAVKIHKGTLPAHNPPFSQQKGASAAEHGSFLYEVSSLKELQETYRGFLFV